jgi:hypothetical protein
LEEHAHHRVNLAGVHIDANPPHAKTFHIKMPTNLGPETIAGISIKIVHPARHPLRRRIRRISSVQRLFDIDRNRSSRESDNQGDKTMVYMWFWISHCPYVTCTSCPRLRWTESQSGRSFIRQEPARNTQ